jgi:hypothetical protein
VRRSGEHRAGDVEATHRPTWSDQGADGEADGAVAQPTSSTRSPGSATTAAKIRLPEFDAEAVVAILLADSLLFCSTVRVLDLEEV